MDDTSNSKKLRQRHTSHRRRASSGYTRSVGGGEGQAGTRGTAESIIADVPEKQVTYVALGDTSQDQGVDPWKV